MFKHVHPWAGLFTCALGSGGLLWWYLRQKLQDRFIPSHRSYSWGTNHSSDVDIGVIRSVRFLDEKGVIHHREERGIIDTVPDPNCFDPLRQSIHTLVAMVAAQEHGSGFPLIVFSHQMK